MFVSKIRAAASESGVSLVDAPRGGDPFSSFGTSGAGGVLADLNYLGADAVSFIARVKESHPGTKVVAFLSHVQVDLEAKARAAGADEVLARSALSSQTARWLKMAAGA